MPSFAVADLKRSFMRSLADPTRMRLEAISFFLLALFLCAGAFQLIWNSLRKEFAWLPRLSYGKSVGVIILWGLLFVLALTMISGAREIMTPGAWEKTGLTYRLRDDTAAVEQQITTRYEAIERLMSALFLYAEGHGKQFPTPIDKDFRIAKPMRKSSWTKRFAARWGERRGTSDDCGSGEGGLRGMGRRCD